MGSFIEITVLIIEMIKKINKLWISRLNVKSLISLFCIKDYRLEVSMEESRKKGNPVIYYPRFVCINQLPSLFQIYEKILILFVHYFLTLRQ